MVLFPGHYHHVCVQCVLVSDSLGCESDWEILQGRNLLCRIHLQIHHRHHYHHRHHHRIQQLDHLQMKAVNKLESNELE